MLYVNSVFLKLNFGKAKTAKLLFEQKELSDNKILSEFNFAPDSSGLLFSKTKSKSSFFLIKKNEKIKTNRKNIELLRLIALKFLNSSRFHRDSNSKNFLRFIHLKF
jgi:hypothetical protein